MATDDRGAFIWYELMTPDPLAVADFYREVIGWEIAAKGDAMPNGGTYHMIARSDGGAAGGAMALSKQMQDAGARTTWAGYVHHPDVDAAVAAVVEASGTTLMPPTDMAVGRIAMVADPQGATLYIMCPVPPADRPDAKSDVFDYAKPGHMRWNELWTTDPAAASSLYTDVFGWEQAGAMPMGDMGDYLFIQRAGGMIGAIGQAQPDGEGSRWQYFAGVDDIDRAARAVTGNGGALLGEPMPIPGGEYSVYAHDPLGATIGLVGPRKE